MARLGKTSTGGCAASAPFITRIGELGSTRLDMIHGRCGSALS